jgi:hypothetical protein
LRAAGGCHALQTEALKEGDVLIVRITPEELVRFAKEPNIELRPIQRIRRNKG